MIIKKDTNAEYHSSSAISASGLKYIWKENVQNFLTRKFKGSAATELGTAIHELILEPELFEQKYYLFPNIGDGRTKEGKALKAQHQEKANGKILLEKELIDAIYKNYQENELAQKYCIGEVEVSHYTKFDGVDVRVRPDCKGVNWISDIKTCQDNSPRAFRRDVYFWGYHLQAAFYSDVLGIDPLNFRFIAIRTKYPFNIAVYSLNPEQIEQGRSGYKSALEDWKTYLNTNIALGYKGKEMAEDGAIIL